jgi:hypothetical protein
MKRFMHFTSTHCLLQDGAADQTSVPCCHDRAIVVPIVTYMVDIGLPLSLLLLFSIIIRSGFQRGPRPQADSI